MSRNNRCRDCNRCTTSFMGNFFGAPAHIFGGAIGGITVNLFKQHCPVCNHLMSHHALADASEPKG